MPNSFGAGNSPLEYTSELISNKSVIFTTTNGTQALLKAKHAEMLLVGSFVNFGSILTYIESVMTNKPDGSIYFMCAGSHGRFSYEDAICSGAFISKITSKFPDCTLTDSAHAAMSLYKQNSVDVKDFVITKEHSKELIRDGFAKDLDIAFEFDLYPVIPYFDGISIKKMKLE
jgi:2-phosphosulfolactate phosphatase